MAGKRGYGIGNNALQQNEMKEFIRLVRKVLTDDKIRDWNLLRKHPYVIMDEYDFKESSEGA